ncbi:hypothetical protein EMCG_02584 [[Emmonsia] crescens]|uniref:Uncharacterized protein n=1 Tax=[Emmonsia] crescens TaxID=73230 RepID=A0A0G2HY97_9EURO|nr:hypothetical protein EMCG_02584 [Emmonsia crescens UAMH 3008]
MRCKPRGLYDQHHINRQAPGYRLPTHQKQIHRSSGKFLTGTSKAPHRLVLGWCVERFDTCLWLDVG